MADNNIKTEIKISNLAPISNLNKDINSSSLKFSIFANNGEGKTFISNMFRLLENEPDLFKDEHGNILTNKFISFGQNTCKFSFKITDKQGVKEDIILNIEKNKVPTIPKTNYIYHVFNQDYIDKNSQANYDKDGNITDYIIGKANIDISKEETLLKSKEKEQSELQEETKKKIETEIEDNIGSIPNIKRLNEYKNYLNYDSLYIDFLNPWNVPKPFKDYLKDYNKIKSVPENIEEIKDVKKINDDIEFIKTTIEKLKESFSLSKIADDFKTKVLSKKEFIEQGLQLLEGENICPFCEQKLEDDALKLIDEYTSFIEDEENKIIKSFENKKKEINNLIREIKSSKTSNLQSKSKYDDYVKKYFSDVNDEFIDIETADLITDLESINEKIDEKIKNISIIVKIEASFDNIQSTIQDINKQIDTNNVFITNINNKLNNLSHESKEIRRNLCKSLFDELAEKYKSDFEKINTLKKEISDLETSIKKKKEANKINKRDKVLETIKEILDFFFSNKYSLDSNTFRLTFKNATLSEGQAKEVLSDGEKTIIAFAYYLGDTHLKLKNIEDYERLFFIIDDPISSMDFNHVYTVSGILRDLKGLLKLENHPRYIILTHNIEFMRIINANKISDKSFILIGGELKNFNNNLTVPYITHLEDIYKISINQNNTKPNHTTANSIRHIIETLTKFEKLELNDNSIKKYIDENFKKDIKIYTLINDLSHGAWRNEHQTISEADFILVCKEIINHIETKYKSHVDYCKNKLT